MRATLHHCLTFVLAVVSVSAPFAHTHDSGKAEEHLAQEHFTALHTHIALPGEDPAISEVDDSARRVNWFRFEIERPVALEPPCTDAVLPVADRSPEGWLRIEASRRLPEESPPRSISPRGPPSLFV